MMNLKLLPVCPTCAIIQLRRADYILLSVSARLQAAGLTAVTSGPVQSSPPTALHPAAQWRLFTSNQAAPWQHFILFSVSPLWKVLSHQNIFLINLSILICHSHIIVYHPSNLHIDTQSFLISRDNKKYSRFDYINDHRPQWVRALTFQMLSMYWFSQRSFWFHRINIETKTWMTGRSAQQQILELFMKGSGPVTHRSEVCVLIWHDDHSLSHST